MSITITGSQDLRRTTSLPSAYTNFTVTAWVKLTNANTRNCVCELRGAGLNEALCFKKNGSNLPVLGVLDATGVVDVATQASANTVGDWYFVGWTNNGTGANTYKTYVGGVTGAISSASGTRIAVGAPSRITMGFDAGSEFLDGAIAAAKMWEATLTASQIDKERYSQLADLRTGLHGEWPMFSVTDLSSRSAPVLTWTKTGSPTSTGQPPVRYSRRAP